MPSVANKISLLEAKCDDVERRLVEKIEITSGFGEAEDQARKMRLSLKFFDTSGNGLLSYEEFFAAMTKFNLVGVQREIEALFNRYDEYVSGFVDYHEFSLRLWGLSPNAITLDVNSRAVINKLKGMLVSTGGASGYHRLMQNVKSIDGVSSGICSRDDLQYAMSDCGVAGLTKAEWDRWTIHLFTAQHNITHYLLTPCDTPSHCSYNTLSHTIPPHTPPPLPSLPSYTSFNTPSHALFHTPSTTLSNTLSCTTHARRQLIRAIR